MKKAPIIAAFLLSTSGAVFAATPAPQDAASDVIIPHFEVVSTPADAFSAISRIDTTPQRIGPFADGPVSIDQIINIGQKVWEIVKANQPVVNISSKFANALPSGVASSADLTGFSDIESSSVRLWGTNLYGMTVYDVTLTAVHQYGGQYQGKGRYLETVAIIPSDIYVVWGYKIDYKVESITTTNGGTAEDPIAKIALNAKFKASTVLTKVERNTVYQFRGDSAEVKTAGF
jgi:hypothetical protein